MLEVIVAIGIALATLGAALAMLQVLSRGTVGVVSYSISRTAIEDFLDRLDRDAASSLAIYRPPTCVGAPSCSSVRFYGVDYAGLRHFWGYEHDAVRRQVRACTYATYDGACAGGTPVISSVDEWDVATIPASRLMTPALLDYRVKDVFFRMLDATVDTRGMVLGGNRVTVVTLGTSYEVRSKHLLPGGVPFRAHLVTSTFAAPSPCPSGSTEPYPFCNNLPGGGSDVTVTWEADWEVCVTESDCDVQTVDATEPGTLDGSVLLTCKPLMIPRWIGPKDRIISREPAHVVGVDPNLPYTTTRISGSCPVGGS